MPIYVCIHLQAMEASQRFDLFAQGPDPESAEVEARWAEPEAVPRQPDRSAG